MIDQAEVRRTLLILAGYSLLCSFLVCPLLWAEMFSRQGGLDELSWILARPHDRVRGFITACLFASVPSGIYWFLARAWLYGGAPVWPVHATYLLLVAPLTLFWFSLVAGPIRNFLS